MALHSRPIVQSRSMQIRQKRFTGILDVEARSRLHLDLHEVSISPLEWPTTSSSARS